MRDLSGRLRRLAFASLSGIAGAIAITLLLPTRDHFPLRWGSCGFSHWSQGWVVEGGDPALMIAGAIAIATGIYAGLGYRVRAARRRVAPLPRARWLPGSRTASP